MATIEYTQNGNRHVLEGQWLGFAALEEVTITDQNSNSRYTSVRFGGDEMKLDGISVDNGSLPAPVPDAGSAIRMKGVEILDINFQTRQIENIVVTRDELKELVIPDSERSQRDRWSVNLPPVVGA